jgi:hypothetical protein
LEGIRGDKRQQFFEDVGTLIRSTMSHVCVPNKNLLLNKNSVKTLDYHNQLQQVDNISGTTSAPSLLQHYAALEQASDVSKVLGNLVAWKSHNLLKDIIKPFLLNKLTNWYMASTLFIVV